jgi:N,N'-diacetyllegionaminate synthase
MGHYLYFETAFHHMGDMFFMRNLIKSSAEIGANGVKFQVLIDYDSFLSEQHSMYKEFKKGTFTIDEWREIFGYASSFGLDIIFMPICPASFKLLEDTTYDVKYIDIHSVSFYDEIVLTLIKQTGIPVILGIGGRETKEIDEKIVFFGNQIKVLMVGFQAFPSNIEEVKLGKISWLRKKYPSIAIGYADHSSYDSDFAISSNLWAFLLGAEFFEKHLTIAEGQDRWDYQSALGVEKCKQIIKELDFLDHKVMGHTEEDYDKIEGKERIYRNRQKVAVSSKDLNMGYQLKKDDVILRMLDSAEGIIDVNLLIGKKTKTTIKKGERLSFVNISI